MNISLSRIRPRLSSIYKYNFKVTKEVRIFVLLQANGSKQEHILSINLYVMRLKGTYMCKMSEILSKSDGF